MDGTCTQLLGHKPMTNDNKPSAAPPYIVDCVSVRVDDLNFLRNMAQRARLDGVDKAQYNEVMDRVMTAQEKFFAAFDDEPQDADEDSLLVARLKSAREGMRLNMDRLDTAFTTPDDMDAVDEAIATLAASHSAIGDGLGALRSAQSNAVMPLIGPLLDAWDGLTNDMLALEELAPVAEVMAQIDSAMEGGQ
jgi:hypothetical protein